MKQIKWKKKFSTGHAGVDHEHQEMIGMINKALTGIAESHDPHVISGLLGDIHAGIASHFALEEELMRKARYDGYQEHKDDHEHLLDEIREIMDTFEGTEGAAVEALLAGRLNTWFSSHFSTLDAKLHKVLN